MAYFCCCCILWNKFIIHCVGRWIFIFLRWYHDLRYKFCLMGRSLFLFFFVQIVYNILNFELFLYRKFCFLLLFFPLYLYVYVSVIINTLSKFLKWRWFTFCGRKKIWLMAPYSIKNCFRFGFCWDFLIRTCEWVYTRNKVFCKYKKRTKKEIQST